MKIKVVENRLIRVLLLAGGFASVILGIIGAMLPVIPTTPFLILAAICFSYSSEKFYNRIITNRYFGKNVKDYLDGKGIPFKAKVAAVSVLWISIGMSCWFIDILWIRILLPTLASFITWFILKQPTAD